MNSLVKLLAVTVFLALPTLASASTWTIDPDHSSTGFKVRHLMVSNVKGVFSKVRGVVTLDDKDLTKSSVEVIVDTASIDTGVAKRDTHLRSPDFLDVAKYPTMTFVSKRIARTGANTLKMTGNLTLHGVTRQVVLDVEGPSQESRDPWGGVRRGASATAKIDRKDFGLTWNKALETGGVLVGDEVAINIEVEMVRGGGR